MELKRLIAEDSKSALQNVRTTYGEDALIVSTNKIGTKTEVICAVDLQPDNATFEEDLATVAPTAASKEQKAPFSASLSTVIDNKPAASDPGLANLVATIQQELLELRESVAAHVDANPHELLPQTANDTATSLCERALRQQYGSLHKTDVRAAQLGRRPVIYWPAGRRQNHVHRKFIGSGATCRQLRETFRLNCL